MTSFASAMAAAAWTGAALALAGAVHAAVNAVLLRRPPAAPPLPGRRVSVLLPVRDEAHRVEPCLRALLAQTARPDMQLLVLDDESTDTTPELVRRIITGAPGAVLLRGSPPSPGWLGKPYACQQLADAADPQSDVLVFVDADVVLAPHAVAATVALLDRYGLDLVSPYPRQRAETVAERLVQPLLQWSWLTFLPLRLAERSARPSLSAANGQLLAVRRAAYRRAGGHAAVRGDVLDDIALLRAVKRAGGRGGVADGTALAECRMYAGWREIRAGYGKSLWAAYGSPAGALAVLGLLATAYLVPPLALVTGYWLGAPVALAGLAGCLCGVAGRMVAAWRTGARVADALAHPLSVAALCVLTLSSLWRRRTGRLEWKRRVVSASWPASS
ncbi:MAG TPA: glycosyltransferase family 2 protein [Micromonosporaceae bacterium]|nr:glycosyltransferase family 2 protein [Micromonosporaceae bacterium]